MADEIDDAGRDSEDLPTSADSLEGQGMLGASSTAKPGDKAGSEAPPAATFPRASVDDLSTPELEDTPTGDPTRGNNSPILGPVRPSPALDRDIIESARPTGGIAPPQLSEERRELRLMQASRDRRTDLVRGFIGLALLSMLAFAIVAPWVSVWVDPDYFDSAKELFPLITTPLVGLIGAAMGFYFGERSTDSPPSSGLD